jgi:hypothetical protein
MFQYLYRADEFDCSYIGLAGAQRNITRHSGRTLAWGQSDQGAAFYLSLLCML